MLSSEAIDTWLRSVRRIMLDVLAGDDPWVVEVNRHLAHAGGKGIRAALVLSWSDLVGRIEEQSAMGAAAVELLHLGSLIHDDVIDGSSVRRGRPSVHARWGNRAASLSGAFIFARASTTIASLGDPVLCDLYASVVAAICDGQIMEIENCRNPAITRERYEHTIDRKTASLFGFSCELGARLVHGTPPSCAEARAYGSAYGRLFQITDDILDLVGDGSPTGRPAGEDLRRGIYTLPTLATMSHGGSASELRELLSSLELEGDQLARALLLVRAGPGIDVALAAARAEGERALRALDVAVAGPSKDALAALIDDRIAFTAARVAAVEATP